MDFDVRMQHGMDYYALLWPEASILKWTAKWWICVLHSFLLHKTWINELGSCGLLVNYCNVFISCLDSHSDGTHSLQRIHCWASDVMLNLFWWKTNYILNGLRVSMFSAIFGWSIPLRLISVFPLLQEQVFTSDIKWWPNTVPQSYHAKVNKTVQPIEQLFIILYL